QNNLSLPDWPRAWGDAPVTATLRATAADFLVEEQLGFELSGSGEHHWLWVEKENLNTSDAAQRLTRFAGLHERDVSFAGLKDKRAITRQWFCLHLLNREVDWSSWNDPALRILQSSRHDKKLRRGAHRSNRFQIVLRDVSGDIAVFEQRLASIGAHGVPNYFGEQRFGRDGRNIELARRWLAQGRPRLQRQQLSLNLSSLRSFLFNEVLAQRVLANNWCTPLRGEVFALQGSASVFRQELDELLRQRIDSGDVHLSGPLPGRPASLAPEDEVMALEQRSLAQHAELVAALSAAGVDAMRRSLRVIPTDWRYTRLDDNAWQLDFNLPKGCFATGIVRELAQLRIGSDYAN
ncbi:MAG TPA: tRNA pseudouridine(13) synthase TruD, partial [Spongiibacteraceae bacterium]|nr:tRNA pseudouridine(13) synthase TruD [Spongiibacteraceae bacterium]